MPANSPAVRICSNCDGFPVAHVSIGARDQDGTLPTLPVVCLHCGGTGHVPANVTTPANVLTSVGR